MLADGNAVYQERLCPTCGKSRALVADSVEWYAAMMRTGVRCKPPRREGRPVARGCPHDCGPCRFHANACHLAVFSVTNVCNMSCPICFTYNRPDRRYFMERSELSRLLDGALARAAPLDVVNVTGGEPTLHPEILGLLEECRRPEIGRVTMNSNGLRLAEDEDLCRHLADVGVSVVLSLHTLKPATAVAIHGRDVTDAKRRALANLQRFGVRTTLLNVMIRGVNDGEIGDIVRLAREHSVVRSVTVQTMTFTGQGGKSFLPRRHMPLDGAARAMEDATAGLMRREHFVPHPSAHPLCYAVAYYLKASDRLRSFTDFLRPDEFRDVLAGGYLVQPDGGEQIFRRAIDRLWADGGDGPLLCDLRGLVERVYPPGKTLTRFERQRAAEESLLAVYLHAHMDEDTLDLARLVACPDQVPDAEGRLVPACAYNLFYRRKDPRFWHAAREAADGLHR
jgi:uncharacterized radical SAM superfamily Fe-S cluster-containing enzyme